MAAPVYLPTAVHKGPLVPLPHLFSLVFVMTGVLAGVGRYLIVISMCISLTVSDTERLFLYLLALRLSPSEKGHSIPLPIFASNYLSLGAVRGLRC